MATNNVNILDSAFLLININDIIYWNKTDNTWSTIIKLRHNLNITWTHSMWKQKDETFADDTIEIIYDEIKDWNC